jgi:hypothetical protein
MQFQFMPRLFHGRSDECHGAGDFPVRLYRTDR